MIPFALNSMPEVARVVLSWHGELGTWIAV
jgi:hypothetical protein